MKRTTRGFSRILTLFLVVFVVVAVFSLFKSKENKEPIKSPVEDISVREKPVIIEKKDSTAKAPTPVQRVSIPTGLLSSGNYTFEVSGFKDRPYILHIPKGYTKEKPLPLVLAIHGGSGTAIAAASLACPDGDTSNTKCWDALADKNYFAVAYPNGTKIPFFIGRAWNAGGGKDGYLCMSSFACKTNVDDVAYFNALLDDIEKRIAVDMRRVYATGHSNGGGMSHRLGCELSHRIAAIGPLSGGNQFAAVSACNLAHPMPVIHFHGTKDMMIPYEGGEAMAGSSEEGIRVNIPQIMGDWAERNGCKSGPTEEGLPDLSTTDGSTVTKISYSNCRSGADVVLYRVNGGGHTYPSGHQYLPIFMVGPTNQDINPNELIWEFFKKHSL